MGEVERGLLAGRTTILRAQFASDMQRLMNKAEAEGGQLIGEPFVYEGDLCQTVQFGDESLPHPSVAARRIRLRAAYRALAAMEAAVGAVLTISPLPPAYILRAAYRALAAMEAAVGAALTINGIPVTDIKSIHIS